MPLWLRRLLLGEKAPALPPITEKSSSDVQLELTSAQAKQLLLIMQGAVESENTATGKQQCFGCGVDTESIVILHKEGCVVKHTLDVLYQTLPDVDPPTEDEQLSKIVDGLTLHDVELAVNLWKEAKHRASSDEENIV